MEMNFKELTQSMRKTVKGHSPEILTGVGIAGMVITTVLAVKATPKAMALIEEEKMERYRNEESEKLSVVDTVKTTWKCYIPAALTGIASISCIVGASSISIKRGTALAAAYKLADTAHHEYRDKVIETIGKETDKEVIDKVAQDAVDRNPVNKSEVIIANTTDNVLCYDSISGRYFESNVNTINAAVNAINKKMLLDNYASLNSFYGEIGSPHLPSIDIGDRLGWKVDNSLEIDISGTVTSDGKPCVVINYRVAPDYDFDMFL